MGGFGDATFYLEDCILRRESESGLAWLVESSTGYKSWLPKSQMENLAEVQQEWDNDWDNPDGVSIDMIEIPGWLASKSGFM